MRKESSSEHVRKLAVLHQNQLAVQGLKKLVLDVVIPQDGITCLMENISVMLALITCIAAAKMAMKPIQNGNMTGAQTVKGKPALKCMFQK